MDRMLKKSGMLSAGLAYVGAVALFGTMCLTAADVVGRYVFNAPILGVFELTEFLVLILIFSFIGYTQSQKNHVAVELLLKIFPEKIRNYIELINHVICLVLMMLITWMGLRKALELKGGARARSGFPVRCPPVGGSRAGAEGGRGGLSKPRHSGLSVCILSHRRLHGHVYRIPKGCRSSDIRPKGA